MSEAETPYTLGYVTVGTVLYVLAGYKARAWAVERIPSLLLMAAAALAAGTGFLAAAPTVYRWLGTTTGVSNVASLVVYTTITACCALFLVLVLLWSPPHSAAEADGGATADGGAAAPVGVGRALRRVLPPYALAIAALVALFLAARLPPGETPLTFDTTFADRPVVLAFLLVYQVAYGWALWSMVYVCRQRAKDVQDPVLRGSLRRLVTGCTFVASYGVCKVVAIGAAALGSTVLEPLSTVVGPAFASAGALIMAIGWANAALRARSQRRRDFHALEALWTTVTRADPGVILHSPPSRSAWEFHVLRRAHEIRDGQLALRPWTSADTVEAARRLAEEQGLGEAEGDALAAAAGLKDALRALDTGRKPRRPCGELPGISVPPHAERQHLVAVARYLDGPLVTRLLTGTAGTER